MIRHLIENVQCGVEPMMNIVIAEAKVKDMEDGSEFYVSLAETGGEANFYRTEVSTYALQAENEEDPEAEDALSDGCIDFGEYEELLDNIDEEHEDLLKYLIYVVRTDNETCREFMEDTIGKCTDEIDFSDKDLRELIDDEDDCDDDEDDEDDE